MQFYRMVKKYLPEKMTAEQQLEGKEQARQRSGEECFKQRKKLVPKL